MIGSGIETHFGAHGVPGGHLPLDALLLDRRPPYPARQTGAINVYWLCI